jgi:competence protein ComGC
MRLNLEIFMKEKEIAEKTGNKNFLAWLDFQIEKYLLENKIKQAKLNKMAEISFLMGDVSIPHQILEKAYNELRMEVM